MADGSENSLGEDAEVDASEELSEEMKQIEAEEAEKAKKVKEHLSQQLNMHFTKLEGDFQSIFDQQMETIASHCQNQASEIVTSRQSDILRTNKVFREICRPLGAKWKGVFKFLTTGLPVEQIQMELEKVEKEKPFMQPYKSLMAWKEMKGNEFDVRDLIPALRSQGLDDLVEKSLDILNCDNMDVLIDMSCIGKSQVPGSSASGPGASKPISSPTVNAEDALDDRHILQLAKKLGGSWEALARALNVSKDEIAEILESEGGSYPGAFKMLWNWRETKSDLRQGLEQLVLALRQLNRQDLEELLC